MVGCRWLKMLVALGLALTYSLGWAQMFGKVGYDGKNGPVSIRDIDWYGPKGSGQYCWWERDHNGKAVTRHCGEPTPIWECSGGANAEMAACYPREGKLCTRDLSPGNTLLGASFGGASCVTLNFPKVVTVNPVKAATGPVKAGVVLGPPFKCTVGQSCDLVFVGNNVRDINIRINIGVEPGTALVLNGKPCKHQVDCQKMMSGDVYPVGVFSPLGLATQKESAANK